MRISQEIRVKERRRPGDRRKTHVANIELVARVLVAEVVVGRWARRRSSVQSLTSHGHPNFARDRGGAEAGFIFTVLTKPVRDVVLTMRVCDSPHG